MGTKITPAILKKAEIIGVIDCACRQENRNCDRPLWTCLYLNEGVLPDIDPTRQSRMKIISAEEAIAYADEAERGGLMHLSTAGNNDLSVALPPVLCNCCGCCCTVFSARYSLWQTAPAVCA